MPITAKDVYSGVPNLARGEVTHISADPSGKTDAIAFPSGRVAIIRSTTNPLECSVFTLHSNPVTAVRFSPDGAFVASGDECGFVRVWERNTHRQTMDEQVMAGPVRDIAFAPDAKHLVVAGEARGAYAKAVKLPSGAAAGICIGHTKRAVACDVSSGKPTVIATGSEDMSVGLFKGPPVREIDIPAFQKQHKGFVNDVRFSPDSSLVALASSDRTISIVDVATGGVARTLEGHDGSVTGVAWSADSKTLYTSANDKCNKEWRVRDGKCLSTFTHGPDVLDMQVGCAYCVRTKSLVSVSLRGDINVMDDAGKAPTRVLRGHSKQIVGLAVVGPRAYSADYSGLLIGWELGVGSGDARFTGDGPATSVCGIAANDAVVASVGQDGKVFVTPTGSLTYAKPVTVKGGGVGIAVPTKSSTAVSCVMINETRVAAVSPTGGEVLAELEFPRGETGTAVAVNAGASLIAVGVAVSGGAGELRFARLTGGSRLAFDGGKVVSMSSPPNTLAFSPDGSLVAVGEASRRVKLYDVAERSSVEGGGVAHTARVDAIAFDPTGTRFASGGMDGSLVVWTVRSDEDPLRELSAHRGGVTGVGFSDAATLVSSGSDSCLRSWTL
jgi:WD repeat-containing protein 1 (actin-interacting protein 1)